MDVILFLTLLVFGVKLDFAGHLVKDVEYLPDCLNLKFGDREMTVEKVRLLLNR